MSTYAFKNGSNSGGVSSANIALTRTVRFVVDFADVIASNSTLTANGYITANDVLQLIDIPAGTIVHWAGICVISAADASVTGTLGDGSQTAGFMAATTLATAGTTGCTVDTDAYGCDNEQGNLYASADTLDMVVGGANCTKGKVAVFVNMTYLH